MAAAGVANAPGLRGSARLGKVIQVLICLAALGVLAENLLLVQQNRKLEEAIAPQIAPGARFETLGGFTLDGRFQPFTLPSDSKLLIIEFSPGCPACQANQLGWMKLAAAAEQRGVRVLWLSRDPVAVTRDYCLRKGIPLTDTLADPTRRTYLQLGLARVPNTVLVGANGTAQRVWAGRLDEAEWRSVLDYFGEKSADQNLSTQSTQRIAKKGKR
jgi:hypothetical protein